MGAEFLAQVPLFADLPTEDLERLCEDAQVVVLDAGETLFEEGTAGDRAYVIEEGELEIVKRSGGREVLLAVRKPGEVIGEMSLLEESPRMASVRGRTAVRLIAIEQRHLTDLVHNSASAARAMFYTVLARWRGTSAMLQQSEKMAQLGTLTAGVAHELNNPAAAVKRGAAHLSGSLAEHERAASAVHALGLDAEQSAALAALMDEARERATRPVELDALARADREEALEDWFDDHDLSDGVDLASALVDLELGPERLDELLERFGADGIAPVVQAVAATHGTYNLLAEIQQGAARISGIVGALKQYSFLDQAPVQEVDLHEGLDNTLLILRSKLKQGISVRREYDPDLPKIVARGSELNQVWTNLIDNAVDALADLAAHGEAQITLRTCHQGPWVMVEIEDNGPGIPPEIQGRIFDAFFTTKAPGKGTGQGLAIAWRIVTDNHQGSLRLMSEPGRTCFQITLPVNFEEAGAAPSALAPSPVQDEERRILEATRRIAVVGISGNPSRAAHTVPAYLQSVGFEIVPVNPTLDRVLGVDAVGSLAKVEGPVDTVLVFRRPEEVPAIVEAAIAAGARHLWLQPGVVHEQAAEEARRAGLLVVMDVCMRQSHKRIAAEDRAQAT